MNHQAYTRTKQRRAPQSTAACALWWLTVLIGAVFVAWVGVQWYTKMLKPYNVYWCAALTHYNASYHYLHSEESMCADTEAKRKFRLALKSHYDDCEAAERVVASWPAWTAFGRLMDDFEFCRGGTCISFEFSALNTLGLLFILITLALAAILVALIVYTCRSMYLSIAGKNDLPFRMHQPPPIILSDYGLGNKQARLCEYPPHTHAYDFNAPRHKNE